MQVQGVANDGNGPTVGILIQNGMTVCYPVIMCLYMQYIAYLNIWLYGQLTATIIAVQPVLTERDKWQVASETIACNIGGQKIKVSVN
jgi:hypothetical protein